MKGIREQLLDIFAGDEPDYDRAARLGPAALPVLSAMVDEDVDLASYAVAVVGLIPSHDSLEILAHAARSDDSELRLHTAGALREFVSNTRSAADLDGASEILAPLLDDENAGVRRFAQRAAAAFPDGAHQSVLRNGAS